MIFFFIVEAFDVRNVFFFFLGNDINTYCRKVVAVILFAPLTIPKIFMVVLVFFIAFALVGKRLLGLFLTRYVSKEGVSKLIFSDVFIFSFCKPISLKILGINLLNT